MTLDTQVRHLELELAKLKNSLASLSRPVSSAPAGDLSALRAKVDELSRTVAALSRTKAPEIKANTTSSLTAVNLLQSRVGSDKIEHGSLAGLADDDHTQYLNNTRHDTTTRHTLGSIVPHDDHGALSGLSDDDHPQYIRHSLATAVSDFLVASGSGAFIKKTLAEVKTLLGLTVDGWTPVSATWTYASASTITVPSGAAAIYAPYDKVKFTQHGTVKFGYVYPTSDTLLTFYAGSDFSVENTATYPITAVYYSHQANPVGFQHWFAYPATLTFNGTAPSFTLGTISFSVVGKNVTIIGTNNVTNIAGATSQYAGLSLPIPQYLGGAGAITAQGMTPNTLPNYLSASLEWTWGPFTLAGTGYDFFTITYRATG